MSEVHSVNKVQHTVRFFCVNFTERDISENLVGSANSLAFALLLG